MARYVHPIHLVWIALLSLTVILAAVGCSGRGSGANLAPDAMALPPLPAGDTTLRQGTAVDSDAVDGDQHVFCENGTDDGNICRLHGDTSPGTDLAYAIYEIPARPDPAVPYMLTVTAFYSDPDPMTLEDTEGYYVAYGDYSSESWIFSGPYYKSTARIPFGPATEVTSTAGNIYIAVVAWHDTSVFVVSAQVDYDAGPGWDEHWVTPVQGASAGIGCDIAVDPDGNPQMAYIRTNAILFMDDGPVFVARRDGGGWDITEVGTGYPARIMQLAIGSNGRRALLLEDTDANNFHLLWDADNDWFENDIIVDPLVQSNVTPSVAFCNGAGIPAGELDTAVVVYAVPDVGSNVKVRYLRYDGVIATGGDVIASTRTVGAIDLYTDDARQVRITLPTSPIPPNCNLHFGVYDAVADSWSFGVPPDWPVVDIDEYDDQRIARACQTGPGQYAVAFILDDRAGLRTGLSSGGPFGSQPEDVRYFVLPKDDFELASYSDGSVAYLARAGNFTLGMYRGHPDSGTSWDYTQVTSLTNGCSEASFAVSADDVSHFAVLNPICGRMEYYRINQFGETYSDIVDAGGGDPGLAFGATPVVATNDDVYVFYNDASRMRVLYSRCRDGQWMEEGVPLNAPDALPYMLLDAGYLEETNLLYVVYLDFFDMSFSVLNCRPGQNNWQRQQFAAGFSGLLAVADNEREVGIAHPVDNPIMDEGICFTKGDPRSSPGQPEVISAALTNVDGPWSLDYSASDGHWGLMINASTESRVTYYERSTSGIWGPPEEVAAVSGIGAYVIGVGVTHGAADGLARIVVEQGPTGPLPYDVAVMRELPTGGFAIEANVANVDAGSVESELSYVVKAADGLPVVIVPTLAPASTWNFEVFMPDGLGGWDSETVWSSPVFDILEETFGFRAAIDPAGMPAVAATEMADGADYFGIVCVYHYW